MNYHTLPGRLRSISLTAFSLFFLLASSCKQPRQENAVQVLRGATLFDGTGSAPVEQSVIVVKDRRIECAGDEEECGIPAGAEIIDLSGKFITPGLVDAHVHFFRPLFLTAGRMPWT